MTLEESVNTLKHHESFGAFIQNVHQMREDAIAELNEASSEQVQKISGKILAYDEVLRMSNYEEIRRRFSNSLGI
jgi:hypothetical protein|tara:strand:- start:365 stop:589 length:225 start_codon:yes stop_codon:yes gene_type:complete